MIVVSTSTPFTALAETGLPNLTGIISCRIVDPSDNVIVSPSTAGIIELLDGVVHTGDYIAARVSPGATGAYVLQWSTDGSYDSNTILSEDMTVVTGVVEPALPPLPVTPSAGPTVGPCTAWVTADEVAACCNAPVGTFTTLYDTVIAAASQLLFELSGRQFTGVCSETVRPCADGCGCWQWITWPASPGVPQFPYGLTWGWWGTAGWGWGWDGCSDTCGCSPLSRATLPGFPVQQIVQVKIDGAVIDPSEYRLDDWRFLTRMADPVSGEPQFWPSCQRLDLDDDQPSTWAVTYTFGQAAPVLGELAAKKLACELYKLCDTGECSIPLQGLTQVNRQGIEIRRAPFVSWAMQKGVWMTGLMEVDAFLTAYNPAGHRRPSSVWSPDLPQFAERLG